MPSYTLSTSNLTQDVNTPAKSQRVKIGLAGTWVGTVDVQYTINGETRTYTDGSFTANDDFSLDPLVDITEFVFTRTSGSVELAVTILENR